MNPYPAKIIKHLDKLLGSSSHQSQIFDDWLEMVHASLTALPNHLANARTDAALTDTAEVQEIWKRLRSRYPHAVYWDAFAGAFGELINSADAGLKDGEYWDVIGDVYMQWGIPNKFTGQFFTPYHIAEAMADITMGQVIPDLHARIREAINKDVYAQAAVLAGLAFRQPQEIADWFLTRVLPAAAPHVDPITVHDPACGSGVMLLAAAAQVPRWALDYNLVRFYGMDIDLTCVRMAQVNCMLYGLNGYGIRCALELSQADLSRLPGPVAAAYAEAQQAASSGDQERVEQIAIDLKTGAYKQANLFEIVTD